MDLTFFKTIVHTSFIRRFNMCRLSFSFPSPRPSRWRCWWRLKKKRKEKLQIDVTWWRSEYRNQKRPLWSKKGLIHGVFLFANYYYFTSSKLVPPLKQYISTKQKICYHCCKIRLRNFLQLATLSLYYF